MQNIINVMLKKNILSNKHYSSQLRYVLNKSAEPNNSELFSEKFEWKLFEKKCVDDEEQLFMPGSGFSTKLQKNR